jgi:hypothetical protein
MDYWSGFEYLSFFGLQQALLIDPVPDKKQKSFFFLTPINKLHPACACLEIESNLNIP